MVNLINQDVLEDVLQNIYYQKLKTSETTVISNSVSRHIIRQMKEEAQRKMPAMRMQALPVTTRESCAKSLCSEGSTDTRPP